MPASAVPKPVTQIQRKMWRIIEEHGWHVKADAAFGGDLLGMIAEILGHMFQRRTKGKVLHAQDSGFLD